MIQIHLGSIHVTMDSSDRITKHRVRKQGLAPMGNLIFSLLMGFAQAAPVPGTSSSALISENLGIYRSNEGFLISSGSSEWMPELLGKEGLFNLVQFAPVGGNSDPATLTVRVDHLSHSQDLGEYTKSWLKDYGHYGFDVLRVKKVKIQGELGVVVDLSHPKHKKMLRQVVFLKNQKAVVLTCKDTSERFAQSLPACNQIIKSFTWVDPGVKRLDQSATLTK